MLPIPGLAIYLKLFFAGCHLRLWRGGMHWKLVSWNQHLNLYWGESSVGVGGGGGERKTVLIEVELGYLHILEQTLSSAVRKLGKIRPGPGWRSLKPLHKDTMASFFPWYFLYIKKHGYNFSAVAGFKAHGSILTLCHPKQTCSLWVLVSSWSCEVVIILLPMDCAQAVCVFGAAG